MFRQLIHQRKSLADFLWFDKSVNVASLDRQKKKKKKKKPYLLVGPRRLSNFPRNLLRMQKTDHCDTLSVKIGLEKLQQLCWHSHSLRRLFRNF